ncbi:MAG TPA: hypothetical protein VFB62_04670, partial [Polyangiaceae bacterium]|nr:hypothetical protein [Polyangiaceae bacterium]
DPPVDPNRFDPQGFRGGQTEQGDDVGLWTSIAIAPDGNPAVAYYDATNHALRFTQRGPDGSWQAGEVQRVERGDVGRYAKLAFIGGQAHIAYLFIEPGEAGAVKSGVRLARGGGGWSFEDVVVDNATPCRHYFCGPGTACVIDTGICTQESNDCAAACADGEECVDIGGMPTCSAIYDTGKLDTYPDAVGLYVSLAQRPNGELAIGYYDRVHGNLMIAVQSGGMWTSQVVDGEVNGTDTGDKGIGASLFVDKDDVFHMSYVDGLSESLNYVALPGGTAPGSVEVVDDGLSAGDGPHLVGDDSHIFVRPGGEVHISYQDATAGSLRVAVGTPSSAMHTWTTNTMEQQGFAGFFSRQIEFDGGVKVLNFWRVASPKAEGNVRLLTP